MERRIKRFDEIQKKSEGQLGKKHFEGNGLSLLRSIFSYFELSLTDTQSEFHSRKEILKPSKEKNTSWVVGEGELGRG